MVEVEVEVEVEVMTGARDMYARTDTEKGE